MIYIAGLFVSITAIAENRVAVIDTGINVNDKNRPYLCKDGHEDFTGYGLRDEEGHGTEVVDLIIQNAHTKNFCVVMLKFWTKEISTQQAVDNTIRAYRAARALGVTIVNYSASGSAGSQAESDFIKTNPQILFVVAAGNDHVDLDIFPRYPASYNHKNMLVVGALNVNGTRHRISNYGSVVKAWEKESATSFSTAVRTGKIINLRFAR